MHLLALGRRNYLKAKISTLEKDLREITKQAHETLSHPIQDPFEKPEKLRSFFAILHEIDRQQSSREGR